MQHEHVQYDRLKHSNGNGNYIHTYALEQKPTSTNKLVIFKQCLHLQVVSFKLTYSASSAD